MIFRLLAWCLIGLFLLLSPQLASAQGATPPASPAQLLSHFTDGGPEMTKQVVDLVGGDKTTLGAVIAFAKTANEQQRKAIANGLAQVAKNAVANDPAFANQIQQAVASSGLPEFAKAYADAAGDTGTASTGGGGGSGGPTTFGPPTGGSNGGSFPGGNNFAANSSGNLLTGGSVGGASFSSPSQASSSQVSPF